MYHLKSLNVVRPFFINTKLLLSLLIIILSYSSDLQARMWSEGQCSENIQEGANNKFYNRGAGLRWNHFLGDWRDARNIKQGSTPFASLEVLDKDNIQTFSVDLTELAQIWINDPATNQGLLVKNNSSSKFYIVSKEHEQYEQAAQLEIISSQGSYLLDVSADTALLSYTYKCGGNAQNLEVSDKSSTLLYFDLNKVPDIISAQLHFSTSENQYGHSNIDFYRVSIEKKHNIGFNLSSKYPNDYLVVDDESLIMVESFENDDWPSNWSFAGPMQNLSLIESNDAEHFEALMGKALQVYLPQGELSALNAAYIFQDKIGHDLDEVYFRYYLRFGESWNTTQVGKLPGIAGTYHGESYAGGWGGRRSNGENGWSIRGYFKPRLSEENYFANRVPIGNYIYHANQTGTWGMELTYDGENPGMLERNRWYCIEQYVKVNTPGQSNGILKAWIDGAPAYELNNLKMRNEGFEHISIDRIWMNIYHGGKDPNNKDIYAFIDNVVVATQPIGPITFDPNLPKAGSEPNRAPIITTQTPESEVTLVQIEIPTEFSISVNEPDRQSVNISWYLDGKLINEDSEYFTYTPTLSDSPEQNLQVVVTDTYGETASYNWTIQVDQTNIQRLEPIEDTSLFIHLSPSLGMSEKLTIGYRNETILLRFKNSVDFANKAIKEAKLILFDEEQYGNAELNIFAGNDLWLEGTSTSNGSTARYIDLSTRNEWPQGQSTWYDTQGIEFGTQPYYSQSIPDKNKGFYLEIDIASFIYDYQNAENFNLVLKTDIGKHLFTSKQSPVESQRPQLVIVYE
ncbi:hypothetical protein N7931_07800 [Catenovulum sp. 2E275]|uniref:polysaccharide lyase n=1 Tax=Catenovulum sp. 2E275 TaxID=2980497 RepID=UPI0021D01AAC|nr:disaggregatase related repeat-containing protein [Catenovulum sp. 2E275]MCU4675538.1 hypothetical protein [Catenovulum sp. 2E275]